MATTTTLITADYLWRMPDNQRRELVKGELRIMAPSGFDHGAIVGNLHFLLAKHVRENNLGLVLGAETGFKLARNPDTVRAPDISFVAAHRIPAAGRPVGFWEGSPDLAIEVLSPSDTVEEVEEKVDDYLSAGTPLVWVINPKRHTVTIHRPATNPTVLRDQDSLDGADIIRGFACSVCAIFA